LLPDNDLENGLRDYITCYIVKDIEGPDLKEFLTNSKFRARVSLFRAPDVVRAIANRHQLQLNKDSVFARELQQLIKTIVHPNYSTLWEMLKSESQLDS
jgi:hypothetical protein